MTYYGHRPNRGPQHTSGASLGSVLPVLATRAMAARAHFDERGMRLTFQSEIESKMRSAGL